MTKSWMPCANGREWKVSSQRPKAQRLSLRIGSCEQTVSSQTDDQVVLFNTGTGLKYLDTLESEEGTRTAHASRHIAGSSARTDWDHRQPSIRSLSPKGEAPTSSNLASSPHSLRPDVPINKMDAMTDRLYYHDSFLYDFEGEITEVVPAAEINARHGVFLDRTAFYPTSGGQVHDTGWISPLRGIGRTSFALPKLRKQKTAESCTTSKPTKRRSGARAFAARSIPPAAAITCSSIPDSTFSPQPSSASLTCQRSRFIWEKKPARLISTPPHAVRTRLRKSELFANQIVQENRPVEIRFVTQQTAQDLGLRKPPRTDKDELRLIDIQDFDLSACGGTHVANTGQIGSILLRKIEKVRQGWRVEFVCGQRAVTTARRDYSTLTEAAALFSGHIWDVPQQVKKSLEEIQTARKAERTSARRIGGPAGYRDCSPRLLP